MRILYLAAGAGGMYCGACARDVALARALVRRGHDLRLLPLYTPLRADTEIPALADVFYGGVSVYLQQRFAWAARLPAVIRRTLDHPRFLRWIAGRAVNTDAASLGPMTLSVLAGREGRQRAALEQLLAFLRTQPPPDIINLSNSLLSGLAAPLKEALGCPIACTVQGEDNFVRSFPEPVRTEARRAMRRNARSIDLFVAPSRAHGSVMIEFLAVAPGKMKVVPAGFEAERYRHAAPRQRQPFTIGTLSAIVPAKGVDLLVEAAAAFVGRHHRQAFLTIAGQPLNGSYMRALRRRLAATGLGHRTRLPGEMDAAGKTAFLRGLSVFVVASRQTESRGMAAMEALASGVPLLVPDRGVFPELIAATGGGLLVAPEDPEALVQALLAIADDPDRADEMGSQGAAAVAQVYGADRMAETIEALYLDLLSTSRA